jgi:hypothetical protein
MVGAAVVRAWCASYSTSDGSGPVGGKNNRTSLIDWHWVAGTSGWEVGRFAEASIKDYTASRFAGIGVRAGDAFVRLHRPELGPDWAQWKVRLGWAPAGDAQSPPCLRANGQQTEAPSEQPVTVPTKVP